MSGRYIDVSSFQGGEVINWAQYVAWSKGGDGVARLCLRVDQGTGTPDAAFAGFYSAAKAAGVEQFIFYHTCYPGLHPDWAGAQAEVSAFLGYLGNRAAPGDLLMLDVEGTSADLSGPADWYYDWCHLCSEDAHWPTAQVVIYANLNVVYNQMQLDTLAQFPLILAEWSTSSAPPAVAPVPWKSLLAWQYTDKASISGIPDPVDADFFLLPPAPPPAPPPPNNNAAILAQVNTIESALTAIKGLL